jgi:hypothetical protein
VPGDDPDELTDMERVRNMRGDGMVALGDEAEESRSDLAGETARGDAGTDSEMANFAAAVDATAFKAFLSTPAGAEKEIELRRFRIFARSIAAADVADSDSVGFEDRNDPLQPDSTSPTKSDDCLVRARNSSGMLACGLFSTGGAVGINESSDMDNIDCTKLFLRSILGGASKVCEPKSLTTLNGSVPCALASMATTGVIDMRRCNVDVRPLSWRFNMSVASAPSLDVGDDGAAGVMMIPAIPEEGARGTLRPLTIFGSGGGCQLR